MAFSIDSTHSVFYNTSVLPTPDDVINSLAGIDKIAVRVPVILRELFPGGPVTVEVYVNNIAAGSLIDDFKFRFLFKDEAAFKAWAKKVRQKTGIEFMTVNYPVVSFVIICAVLFGAQYAATRMLGREGGGNSISGISDNAAAIINNGTLNMNISPAELKNAIEKGAGNMLNMSSNVCKMIAPAKRTDSTNATIIIDSNESLKITTATISETPIHVDRSVIKPEMIFLADTEIVIRSLDLDNISKGWSVVVPGHFDKRIPMEVAPGVDMSKIPAGRRIKADIELYYTLTDEGDRKYKLAHLRKIK